MKFWKFKWNSSNIQECPLGRCLLELLDTYGDGTTSKTTSTNAILWHVSAIFDKRATSVEVDTRDFTWKWISTSPTAATTTQTHIRYNILIAQVLSRFCLPLWNEAAPRPSLFRGVRQFVWNHLESVSCHFFWSGLLVKRRAREVVWEEPSNSTAEQLQPLSTNAQ